MLPIFSLLLAALTQWIARKFQWDAPPFGTLTILYGIGILSHILLDLVTTFGTMVWSPLAWSRPAWDFDLIVDFTFTASCYPATSCVGSSRSETRQTPRGPHVAAFYPCDFCHRRDCANCRRADF